jgi:hypothetical protein
MHIRVIYIDYSIAIQKERRADGHDTMPASCA